MRNKQWFDRNGNDALPGYAAAAAAAAFKSERVCRSGH